MKIVRAQKQENCTVISGKMFLKLDFHDANVF